MPLGERLPWIALGGQNHRAMIEGAALQCQRSSRAMVWRAWARKPFGTGGRQRETDGWQPFQLGDGRVTGKLRGRWRLFEDQVGIGAGEGLGPRTRPVEQAHGLLRPIDLSGGLLGMQGLGGGTLWFSAITILMTLATPAANWVCPMLLLSEPSQSGRSGGRPRP